MGASLGWVTYLLLLQSIPPICVQNGVTCCLSVTRNDLVLGILLQNTVLCNCNFAKTIFINTRKQRAAHSEYLLLCAKSYFKESTVLLKI